MRKVVIMKFPEMNYMEPYRQIEEILCAVEGQKKIHRTINSHMPHIENIKWLGQ